VTGVAGESDACYIASIFGQSAPSGASVSITSGNKLGTVTSSKRFKDEIKPMDESSDALFALKPVTFRYKKNIDPAGIAQFGLVAEDVEKVNPDLVVRDRDGKPYSVRYDQVNAMLLNEFLKEHRKVDELQRTVAEQQKNFRAIAAEQKKEIQALAEMVKEQAAQIQKVNARLELTESRARTVVNDTQKN
jgi:predicted ribosome quality control (RQC) complex YloA/Tae2 family protein